MPLTQIKTGGVDDNISIDNNTLKVDGTNNRVGIGESSPTANLEITPGTGAGTLLLNNASGSMADGALNIEVGSSGAFYETRKSGGLAHIWYAAGAERLRLDSSGRLLVNSTSAYVSDANFQVTDDTNAKFVISNPGNASYSLAVGTDNALAFKDESNGAERMRLDISGRLGLGTSSPAHGLLTLSQSASSAFNALVIQQGNTGSAATDGLHIGIDSGVNAYITHKESRALAFGTANTERFRVDSSGNLFIGGTTAANADIALNANGSATFAGSSFLLGNYTFNSTTTSGVEFDTGSFTSQRASSTGASSRAHAHRFGQDITYELKNDGSATFAERVKAGHAAVSGTSVDYGITAYANRTNVSNTAAVFAQNFNSGGRNFAGVNSSGTTTCSILGNGNATFAGSLSKGSGSFKISHPLSAKAETHHLVHSFIEGPQADLIYRGYVDLVDGQATVNIDNAGRMSEGTFEVLCTNVSCFTSNESDWTAVKGSVTGNVLTIAAQDATATSKVSWMVVGERKDQHMIDTDWTDASGRVITEPEKVVEAVEETEE